MSARYAFTNRLIDRLILGTPWTRQIPFAALKSAMPAGVTPALESDGGRGAPVFDLFNLDTFQLVALKVAREERCPRNVILTTGRIEHISGILEAINRGLSVPTMVAHWNPEERQWYQVDFDAGEILRKFSPVEPTGERGVPVTYSNSWRPSGGRKILYRGIRLNLAPLGLRLREVSFPSLPKAAMLG